MNFPKKTAAGAAVLGAGYYGLSNYAPEVLETAGTIASGVTELLSEGSALANTLPNMLIGETMIGAAAPFAFPMIAGGYAGKKLADVMKIEGEIKNWLVTAGGVGAGALAAAAATGTAFAPLLTVAGAGYAGYKTFQGLKYTGRKMLGGVKGAYAGVKEA